MEMLDDSYLGNTVLQWGTAAVVLVVTVFVMRTVQHVLYKRVEAFSRKTTTYWDDVLAAAIAQTKLIFIFIAAIAASTYFLELPGRIRTTISSAFVISLLMQAGLWGVALIAVIVDANRKRAMEKNLAAVTTINVIALAAKVVLWAIVILLALDNVGVNVTGLIAGLGIGGVAIALALQKILSDLFASLSIVFDKPFVNGDFLIIDDYMGSVEHIGLKTTRFRSLSGEQLVFSNSDLLNSRIRNYGRMFERRVVFKIGVTYQTPRAKLTIIPGIIQEAIEAQQNTRFDRAHFMEFGDYALVYETVYFVLSSDYNSYMDIQQSIYFTIHERFEAEGIDFAFPTQTVFISKAGQPDEPERNEKILERQPDRPRH
jgi:small-conductance mechanosensitive channel